jgi:hypothetical protein
LANVDETLANVDEALANVDETLPYGSADRLHA